jgi:hypothetical protein
VCEIGGAMDYQIIDADGHVIEDDSLFDYLESSYRAHDHQLSWDRLFPSLDFHHIGADDILHEIQEVTEAPLADEDKRAVLRDNAKRFYQI